MTSLQTFTPSRLVTKKAKKKALDRNENAGSYHQLRPECAVGYWYLRTYPMDTG